MTRNDNVNTITAPITHMVYSPEHSEVVHVANNGERAYSHCAHLDMARRLADLEGVTLEVRS